jgi:hypothetical protein
MVKRVVRGRVPVWLKDRLPLCREFGWNAVKRDVLQGGEVKVKIMDACKVRWRRRV